MTVEIPFEIRSNIYQKVVEETIVDGRLNSDEKVFFEKLQRDLELPEETAQRIYSAKAKEYLERYLEAVISDERFSPEEEWEINAISESLGVKINYDEEMESLLKRYRLYWMIENEGLKDIEVGINLQSDEKCYFDCDADWYECKYVDRPDEDWEHPIRYGRPTLKTKIAQNFYCQMSDLFVRAISDDLFHIDTGRLLLTSKRLVFMGTQNKTSVELIKILGFIPYKNGVEIREEAGKNSFLVFDKDTDVFTLTLGRVIQDFGQTSVQKYHKIVELW